MITLYLVTVLISYVLLREGVKRQLEKTNRMVFEETAIMIVMLFVPVLNLLMSVGMFFDLLRGKTDAASLIERFFFIKR